MKKYFVVYSFLIIVICGLVVKRIGRAENSPVSSTASSAVQDTLGTSQNDSEIPPVLISQSSAGEVNFPHQQHFEEFELECKVCHHEVNAANLDVPHEAYFDDFWIDCAICHHKDGTAKLEAQACSKCHHTTPTDIADETLSSKIVIHKNCWECHEISTGEEASQNCGFCHIKD